MLITMVPNLKILILLLIALLGCEALEDSIYWTEVGNAELREALEQRWNEKLAKNVVIFVGDGMSPDTIAASRIYDSGETGHLRWERFPHVGLLKTYNTDKQVPDSASTATALFGGVKTNYEVVGVDSNVKLGDCKASLRREHHVQSVITWAQAAGKKTGFVTTTRVTHATPAPLYAHAANRRWECEAKMPTGAKNCKDIARQLVEDEPGRSINVIMGGGRQMLKSNATPTEFDPLDTWACFSADGRDLLIDWARDKSLRSLSHAIVQNNEDLASLDHKNLDYVLGVFANGHLAMDFEREKGPKGQPSLENMTVAALKVLGDSPNGFVLVVEGGLIDFAHHRGHAAQALLETVRLSEAVDAALKIVDTEETLVIVTSDHTHSMSFAGYPDRGSSILGIAQASRYDKTPYTTLMYSTGGPNNMAYEVGKEGRLSRKDPSREDTEDFRYSQQSAVVSDEAYHGGGDVAVYATGPHAHLFHTTHEQNYVAHVMAYAAKIGPYASSTSPNRLVSKSNVIFVTLATALVVKLWTS